MDHRAVDHIQPEPFIEMIHRLVHLAEPEHEVTDGIRFCHPLGTFCLQYFDPFLRLVVVFHQPVIPGKVPSVRTIPLKLNNTSL